MNPLRSTSPKRRYAMITAGIVLVILVLALVTGGGDEVAENALEPASPQVRIVEMQAQDKTRTLVIYGVTEAIRKVSLEAQVEGQVEEVNAREGSFLKAGEVIVTLASRDRARRLLEARAKLRQEEEEYTAAKKLQKQGYRGELEASRAAAELEAARAGVKSAELAADYTRIRAPFDGFLDHVHVRTGDLVGQGGGGGGENDSGSGIATFLDLSTMLLVGQVPESDILRITPGQAATARLPDGRMVEGPIRFVGRTADPATRTYRVEVEVPNPEGLIPDGMSVEMRIPAGKDRAYLVSPAVLSLDDEGRLGVKTVTESDTVEFHPVQMIDEGPEGVWLAGLPDHIRLITFGHGFVSVGQTVTAVTEGMSAP